MKGLWILAIFSSGVFVIQALLTFTGSDAGDGLGADFDGHLDGGNSPYQLFSFRNLNHFLLGFSWSGISLAPLIPSVPLLIAVACVTGLGFIGIFFLVISQLQKLAEDNSFKITQVLNQSADVYTPVPASMSGKGKISLSIKGSYHELDAMTEGEALPTGTPVKIIRLENQSTPIVVSLSKGNT